MKAISLCLIGGLFVSALAQGPNLGHYDKNGHWVPSHSSKNWQGSKPPKGLPKMPKFEEKKRHDPFSEAARHPGKHQEYKYIPGHYTKSGHWIEGKWEYVWVKDN